MTNKKYLYNVVKTGISLLILSIIVPVFFIFFSILCLLPAKIRYKNRIYYFLTTQFSKLLLHLCFIKFVIKGIENIPQTPAILIANHTSAFDVPIIEMLLGSYPRIWMSKSAYAKTPLLGFILKRLHILIEKSTSKLAINAITKACDLGGLYNAHIILFPEGRRHHDGLIHPFYSGFAIIAKTLQRPVVPIIIHNAHIAFPKGSFFIQSTEIVITILIGPSFVYNQTHDLQSFVQQVQYYCEHALKKMD